MSETRIQGGCHDCNAFQTIDDSQAPLYRLVIHHDATCPALDSPDPKEGVR